MEDPSHNVSALVAYDGTDYHGFQAQVGVPTIQVALEAALDAFATRRSRVVGAGRTDAGVHADGQVVAAAVHWAHGWDDLQRAWNVHLPDAITVRSVRPAPAGFHPRFSAASRTYRYTVQHYRGEERRVAPRRSPLTDRYALWETNPLDVEAMQAAAGLLVGRHDFASFGQPPQGESTERTVFGASWQVMKECAAGVYPGQRLVFVITADAFLQQMVRSLVGSLLAVGRGEWTVAGFAAALAARQRQRSAPPAAPQGLVLERVTYPGTLDALIHGEEPVG